jgi:hypothetical protein
MSGERLVTVAAVEVGADAGEIKRDAVKGSGYVVGYQSSGM